MNVTEVCQFCFCAKSRIKPDSVRDSICERDSVCVCVAGEKKKKKWERKLAWLCKNSVFWSAGSTRPRHHHLYVQASVRI